MNYLAHFHLASLCSSEAGEGLISGALLGDYVKGPLSNSTLPPAILAGIKLHRHIDSFSDQHHSQRVIRAMLPAHLQRYGGIIWDVFCDHFLSLHWHEHEERELAKFNAGVYQVLEAHRPLMPLEAQSMVSRLSEHNVLGCYHSHEAIEQILARISTRLKRHVDLSEAMQFLHLNRADLSELFTQYYPDLCSFSRAGSDWKVAP